MTVPISNILERLRSAARDQSVMISNLFSSVEQQTPSGRSIRLLFLKATVNNQVQVGTLVGELCDSALDYCIGRKELAKAIARCGDTGSGKPLARWERKARHLFTDLKTSGEGGELLLFVLAESVLKVPLAVSKMSLKTSSRMHFHGADGIYVGVSPASGTVRLHFGESKLYADGKQGIAQCVASIAPILRDEGALGSARQDAFVFSTHLDLGDPNLEDAVTGFLDPGDPRFMVRETCGILLVGHNLSDYPVIVHSTGGVPVLSAMTQQLLSEMLQALDEEADANGLPSFHLDIFVVPFPSVQDFRDALIKELGV